MQDKVINDLRNSTSADYIKSLKSISFIILSIPLFLFVLFIFMYFRSNVISSEKNFDNLIYMSIFHLIIFIISYPFSNLLFSNRFKPDSIKHMLNDNFNIDKYLQSYRTARIVQLSIIEAPAVFGLVTCIKSTNGVIQNYPLFLINILSFIILIIYIFVTFPKKNKIELFLIDKLTVS